MKKEPKHFKIVKPLDYKKIKLPYFKEWVSALESGRYNQTTGKLCRKIGNKKVGYCCLGLLCRLQGRLLKDNADNYFDADSSTVVLDSSNPCYPVLSFIGKFPKDCRVETDTETAFTLAGCNDQLGLSFKDIAKIIRAFWKT
jgi:hypothetical protein